MARAAAMWTLLKSYLWSVVLPFVLVLALCYVMAIIAWTFGVMGGLVVVFVCLTLWWMVERW